MKCLDPGLNQGPLDLQSNALPTELSRLQFGQYGARTHDIRVIIQCHKHQTLTVMVCVDGKPR